MSTTPDDDLHERFFAAIERGDSEQVEQMVGEQPTLANARNAGGVSATLFALYYHEPDIAAWLTGAGAEISVFEAAALGRLDALSAALASDPAQVNAISADGFTPLGLAAFFGQAEAARSLLDHGADPNIASANAMRVAPLHSAVAAQQLAIAEALLQRGAQVNAVQADDFTPLHEAAQNGQVEMIALLLAHGADPAAETSEGKTPLAIAEEAGQQTAAALLRERAG